MAESSPLEAAAKARYDRINRETGVTWESTNEAMREFQRELMQVAIAAYEAEQPAPDLGDLEYIFGEATGSHSAPNVRAGLAAVLAHMKGETR